MIIIYITGITPVYYLPFFLPSFPPHVIPVLRLCISIFIQERALWIVGQLVVHS